MPLFQASENDAEMPACPRSAGDLLRQQRENRGLTLGDVAAALRIKPRYLAALEAGRPDRLPGPTYAIGFVRAYAEHLGLDGGEILRRFKQESTTLAAKPDLAFPLPLGERSIPGGGMLLAGIILTISGYGAWYYLSSSEGSAPQRVVEVPIALLPHSLKEGRSPPAAAPSTEAVAAPLSPGNELGPADMTSAQSESAGSSAATLTIATAAPIAAAPGAPPGLAPTTSQRADGSTRIVVRATADSWVEIRGPGRSVLMARLLRAGDSYRVPDQAHLSMRTGNAGGLEITVDGSPAPSIGRMGMVRRNVALDPQALILGSAIRD